MIEAGVVTVFLSPRAMIRTVNFSRKKTPESCSSCGHRTMDDFSIRYSVDSAVVERIPEFVYRVLMKRNLCGQIPFYCTVSIARLDLRM